MAKTSQLIPEICRSHHNPLCPHCDEANDDLWVHPHNLEEDIEETTIEFFIPGRPAPQGSKQHIGHGRMLESSPYLGPWRERVAIAGHNAMRGQKLLTGPIALRAWFVLPRAKSAPKSYTPPAIKQPDTDKLARAVQDAFTNTMYLDDAQVIDLHATKRTAEPGETPGVHITIWETT